jgi:DegV family protein with EDD domain
MIDIISDSCCDLTSELIETNHILIVPLYVSIGEQSYRDGVDIQTAQLFDSVVQTGKLPKTSAPSIGDFVQIFNQTEGDIIFIGISSKLSATFQNATLAARQMENRRIYLIDSANLSTGIGLLVMKAVDLKDAGYSAPEICAILQQQTGAVHTAFMIDTLEYLYMGGRCSAMQNIVGSLLKIRPIIEVRKDGTLGIKDKTRGARLKGLNTLLEDFKAQLSQADLKRVFITHTGCSEDANYLKQELLKIAPIDHVYITNAGATIASHCGPGTIGLLYLSRID